MPGASTQRELMLRPQVPGEVLHPARLRRLCWLGMAVAKMEGFDWGDPEAIGKLRVRLCLWHRRPAVGGLQQIASVPRERRRLSAAKIHPVTLMEDVLYGCDVMPSAIQITGFSTLAGIQSDVMYEPLPAVHFMPYGRQARCGTVKIGLR